MRDGPEAALRARDRRRHHGPSDGLDPLSERPRCGRDRGRRHGLPRSWSESTPMAWEDGFSSSWGAPRGARTRGPAAGTTTPPPRRPTVLAIRAASGSTSLALGPSAKLRLIGKAQVELSRPAMKHGLRGNRDILRSPFGYRASESSAERLLGVALLRLITPQSRDRTRSSRRSSGRRTKISLIARRPSTAPTPQSSDTTTGEEPTKQRNISELFDKFVN